MANRNKAKGSNFERELISMFWSKDWGAVRIAGSGSSRFPSPDILASNSLRKVAIECKFVNKDRKYFPNEEIEQLELFAEKFGAEPWVAIKFSRKGWFFIRTSDLNNTKGMFLASLQLCLEKGLDFDRLLKIIIHK